MYLIHACTIFPIYLQNYSNAINLPITLKALSITDVSHASRRSANSLNRCPMQYVIGFFKSQDKAPTYFPTCFTLIRINRISQKLVRLSYSHDAFISESTTNFEILYISAICYSSPKSIDAHLTNQFLSL